mgnify:CR=1 FL=1
MHGRRGKTQPLGSAGNGWEIYRLYVNTVIFEQPIRQRFGVDGVTDHHRDDMSTMINDRQSKPFQA